MKALFDWFVTDVAVWIIAGFASWKAINAVKEQKIGNAVITILLGGAAYYFVKNPTTVFDWVANVVGRAF
ncbi:TPA: hypothetical protein U1W74_000485 [Streptococcus suis]|uniref:TcpD family membrane protein n=1 Tax=Streptococcus suis TaxID=1307 RepID=UPI000CF647B1|nr:TcpD family membrane protein [Streptococcus suis]NQK51861.1 hypothetical protein [Streptococcus suis]HEM2794812.1 hypothetical protein [Streptococcus suis]HEM4176111.1 hypothetical protein [Streptococcus suis]